MISAHRPCPAPRRDTFSSIELLEARIAPAVFHVTSLLDDGSAGTLRNALAKADAHPGHDIVFFHLPKPPAHGANVITLSSGELTSTGNVSLIGPGAGKLIIDANNASRVFNFNDQNESVNRPVLLRGLSVFHGNASDGDGGGIFASESLSLRGVVVSANTASGSGGGIEVSGDVRVSMAKVVITGNSATNGTGGGLDCPKAASVRIQKTLVTGNNAPNSAGGGVFVGLYDFKENLRAVSVIGSVISGNKSSQAGGIYVQGHETARPTRLVISRSRISGNTVTTADTETSGGAGGLQEIACSTLISRSIISGNTTSFGGGGGISLQSSGYYGVPLQPVKIFRSVISANIAAYGAGGGILASSGLALTISRSHVSDNRATYAFGGGLVSNGSRLAISHSVFSDNVADTTGGGIVANGDKISIVHSTVTGNTSGDNGGGLFLSAASSVSLRNDLVTSNVAKNSGGGLYIGSVPKLQVRGGAVTHNSAISGGGIFAYQDTGSIRGVTISRNVASFSGGGVQSDENSTILLQIAKVTGNLAPKGSDVYGPFSFT